ncbi:hypothetical protein CIPAW_14G110000 [Carya illinoinensis]|uniref:Uncharacterized protein n=1 Tax=Carya illinoinensis TaxID=32201 RepID=A0A8T1NDB8_CARIL|nr:hypothetical protein CIPAW_14G110000 [Carya illinoinensis]
MQSLEKSDRIHRKSKEQEYQMQLPITHFSFELKTSGKTKEMKNPSSSNSFFSFYYISQRERERERGTKVNNGDKKGDLDSQMMKNKWEEVNNGELRIEDSSLDQMHGRALRLDHPLDMMKERASERERERERESVGREYANKER